MKLLKALYAFYRQLVDVSCAHAHVNPVGGVGICPDCGYRIQVLWHLLRCRTCGAKRQAKVMPDQQVKPVFKYCQHCASVDYQLVKRSKIHIYEMPYAVCLKEIDYAEPKPGNVAFKYREYAARNPFESTRPKMFEGEVIKKVELIRPGRLV